MTKRVSSYCTGFNIEDLKDYMRQAGEVTYADAHKDRKNEGVVEFATYGDMKNALVKLEDLEIHGRKIKLVEQKQKGGRHGRSSSRSRSRSRSRRSRSRSARRSHRRSRSRSPRKSRSQSARRSRSRSARRSTHDSPRRSANNSSPDVPRHDNVRRESRRSESRSPQKSRSPRRSLSHGYSKNDRGHSRRDSARGDKDSRSRSRSPMDDNKNDRSDDE